MENKIDLPHLPLDEWENTKTTLHLILQIIGKTRLKLTPRKNHWWFITEYISPKGFNTGAIPYMDGLHTFEVTLNVHKSRIELENSMGEESIIELKNGISIAEIYESFMQGLTSIGVEAKLVDKPFDMGIEKRFSELKEYNQFDIEYVRRFWKILLWVDGVMQEFSGRFYGKTCPVQLYWHHMDLAVTRFSGRKGPNLAPEARTSDKDAYSHEVISFGFWAGDDQVREPAFYSYTYPSPEGIDQELLKPSTAAWVESNGSPTAFLSYANLLKEADPREALLDFFETAYQAGGKLGDWDLEGMKVKELSEL